MNYQKIFADDKSWPAIMKWGMNTEIEWCHPLTSNQYKKYNMMKEGTILSFMNNYKIECEVIVTGMPTNAEYEELLALHGPFQILGGWDFTHVIRVRRI